jgi:hypothetical protein
VVGLKVQMKKKRQETVKTRILEKGFRGLNIFPGEIGEPMIEELQSRKRQVDNGKEAACKAGRTTWTGLTHRMFKVVACSYSIYMRGQSRYLWM